MADKKSQENLPPLRDRLALRVKEVAAMLGVSERKVREIQHTLPRVVMGGVILFPRHALERWLDEQAMVEGDRVEAAADEALRTIVETHDR